MAHNYCEEECDMCERELRLSYLKIFLWVALGAAALLAIGFWGAYWWTLYGV